MRILQCVHVFACGHGSQIGAGKGSFVSRIAFSNIDPIRHLPAFEEAEVPT